MQTLHIEQQASAQLLHQLLLLLLLAMEAWIRGIEESKAKQSWSGMGQLSHLGEELNTNTDTKAYTATVTTLVQQQLQASTIITIRACSLVPPAQMMHLFSPLAMGVLGLDLTSTSRTRLTCSVLVKPCFRLTSCDVIKTKHKKKIVLLFCMREILLITLRGSLSKQNGNPSFFFFKLLICLCKKLRFDVLVRSSEWFVTVWEVQLGPTFTDSNHSLNLWVDAGPSLFQPRVSGLSMNSLRERESVCVRRERECVCLWGNVKLLCAIWYDNHNIVGLASIKRHNCYIIKGPTCFISHNEIELHSQAC